MMKLYYDPISTTSRPVTLMLAEAAISVEQEIISIMLGEQALPSFLAINPKGMVPALALDDGVVLTEVAAILMYLARQHAPHLYPDDIRAQARIDEMMSWFSTDVHLFLDFCTIYPNTLIRGALEENCAAALARMASPKVEKALSYLDSVLMHNDYVAGQTISIADFLGYSFISLADLIDFDFTSWPHVSAWLSRMNDLPGRAETYAAFEGLLAAQRATVSH